MIRMYKILKTFFDIKNHFQILQITLAQIQNNDTFI